MPATTQDYSNIRTMQNTASDLTAKAGNLTASSNTLGDSVMSAVRADRIKRGISKIATDVGNVSGQMVSDPQGIRDRTRGIVDPTSVNTLTAGARAQNLNTLGTIATQQTLNQAPIDEVINAESNKLKARAGELLALAEQEMSRAKSLQDEWDRQMAERKQAFDESNSGSGGFDIASLIALMNNGNTDTTSDPNAPENDGAIEIPESPMSFWDLLKGTVGAANEPTQLSSDISKSLGGGSYNNLNVGSNNPFLNNSSNQLSVVGKSPANPFLNGSMDKTALDNLIKKYGGIK